MLPMTRNVEPAAQYVCLSCTVWNGGQPTLRRCCPTCDPGRKRRRELKDEAERVKRRRAALRRRRARFEAPVVHTATLEEASDGATITTTPASAPVSAEQLGSRRIESYLVAEARRTESSVAIKPVAR